MGKHSDNKFKRYELKYLIKRSQMKELLSRLSDHLVPDSGFFHSSISNIYYDTPSFLYIRRSLEQPVYKEKLRVRGYGYGSGNPEGKVYVELKKKYQSIVYKRRISMTETEAGSFLRQESPAPDSQIGREIAYLLKMHPDLRPAMYISYERDAYAAVDEPEVRVTFDDRILWRHTDLSLASGPYGDSLLAPDTVLMEIKVGDAFPLWLTKALSDMKIQKTRFSKYGAAYQALRKHAKRMIYRAC